MTIRATGLLLVAFDGFWEIANAVFLNLAVFGLSICSCRYFLNPQHQQMTAMILADELKLLDCLVDSSWHEIHQVSR